MDNIIVLLRRLNKVVKSNTNYTADLNELADSLDIDMRETHMAFYQLIGMGYIIHTGIGYNCSITTDGIHAASRSRSRTRHNIPVLAYNR